MPSTEEQVQHAHKLASMDTEVDYINNTVTFAQGLKINNTCTYQPATKAKLSFIIFSVTCEHIAGLLV